MCITLRCHTYIYTKRDSLLIFFVYFLLEWRQEELETINASLSGAKRKAALCHLLDQETQLIASIGRHKLEADTENKQRAIQKFLDKVGKRGYIQCKLFRFQANLIQDSFLMLWTVTIQES